ncbi:MAG: zinc ABC transporter substrate-binding protein [Verrucomicrobia bacterium]|nr:MAG: zinc ABC transporter substrate-binding protein [Verrucomicrobiota bacterium]
MKSLKTFLLILLSVAAVPAMAKLNVVATTADFGALAQAIGGDLVNVTVLAKPTEDPHFVDAKPSYMVKLNRADVLIEGGAELEIGWLPPLLDGARNAKIAAGQPGHVAVSDGLALLEVPAELDRSKGDLHAKGNPHFMIAPSNARHAAQKIAESFSAIDPAQATTYQQNLTHWLQQLDTKLTAWKQKLAPFAGQQVAAFHKSWPYFAHCFDLKIEIFLEPKPGIPPSPAHLAEVIETMKREHVKAIIMEPFQNRRTAAAVAAATGAQIVECAQFPGGLKGTAGDYLALLDKIVDALVAALAAK